MKVAVTYENGEVFQHFGRTPQLKIYEIENGEVKFSQVIDTGETGHGALAGFLQEAGANVMICLGAPASGQWIYYGHHICRRDSWQLSNRR